MGDGFGIRSVLGNSGRISTSGEDAHGVVLLHGNSSTLTNRGSINTAGRNANGVFVQSHINLMTNTGDIVASGPGSAGVRLGPADTGRTNLVVNATQGVVTSLHAQAVLGDEGVDRVENAGTLSGNGTAVDLAGGDDTLLLQSTSVIVGVADGGAGTDRLILGGDANGTFTLNATGRDFVNFETLAKEGNGSWQLTGSGQFGETRIDAGILTVTDSLTSAVTVNGGGTLGGTGTVIGPVASGGVVSPGNSVGVLTINGSYVQSAAGTLVIEVDAAGNTDQLRVVGSRGTATLAGTLLLQGTTTADIVTNVLTATGGVIGGFDTVQAQPGFAASAGILRNAVRIATVSTSGFDSQVDAGLENGYGLLRTLSRRLHEVQGTEIEPSADGVARQVASCRPDGPGKTGGWLKGLGWFGERDTEGRIAGYDFSIGGMAAGADTCISEGVAVGGAIAYTHADIDVDSGGRSSEADSVPLGAYGGYDARGGFVDVAVTGGTAIGRASAG